MIGDNPQEASVSPRFKAQIEVDLVRNTWMQSGKDDADENFFPINVEWVIRSHLGWNLEIVDQENLSPGDLLWDQGFTDFEKRLIQIAKLDYYPRMRMTLAHEIGHVVMHKGMDQPPIHRSEQVHEGDKEGRKREKEAYAFAMAFLMPQPDFRRIARRFLNCDTIWTEAVFRRVGRVPEDRELEPGEDRFTRACYDLAKFRFSDHGNRALCDFFLVSPNAAARRLAELGIVTA